MRYAVSGSCTDSLEDATLSVNLIGKNISLGKVFWLRHAYFCDMSAAATVHLMDLSQGVDCTAAAGVVKRKMSIPCASGRVTILDIPAPGLKFSTGCCAFAHLDATLTSSGILDYGQIGGNGYEE